MRPARSLPPKTAREPVWFGLLLVLSLSVRPLKAYWWAEVILHIYDDKSWSEGGGRSSHVLAGLPTGSQKVCFSQTADGINITCRVAAVMSSLQRSRRLSEIKSSKSVLLYEVNDSSRRVRGPSQQESAGAWQQCTLFGGLPGRLGQFLPAIKFIPSSPTRT